MRAYTLGNGSLHVGVDIRGQVRDLYFPRVGRENHIGGRIHRIGVFADGTMRWFDDDSWQITARAAADTMAGETIARNDALGVEVILRDIVYNEKNIFLRNISLTNLRGDARTIYLFFAHEMQMGETTRGDTAYYDPRCHAIVHYEGRRMLLFGAKSEDKIGFDQWAVGLNGIEGKEGAYKDAEDGELSNNGIEHGQVDSVFRLAAKYSGNEKKIFNYWVCAGRFFADVNKLNNYIEEVTPEHLETTASDYWRAWLKSQNITFGGLPSDIVQLFMRSLLVVRAHVDGEGGIIAASDTGILNQGRDTYAYVWPRDASYAARALLLAGDTQGAQRFFRFCNKVVSDEGYFMHKYLPDGSIGSSWHPWVRNGAIELPIQADETAIVLIVLREYFHVSRDLEFIEEVFNSLVRKSADFLMEYTDAKTGLPLPSYDLWEEVYCVTTYTASATYQALRAAADLSKLLGKHELESVYERAASKIKDAILAHLFDEARGVFYKAVYLEGNKMRVDPTLDFSSVYGVFEFGVLPPDDPRLVSSMNVMDENLYLKGTGTVGGMPRFTSDNYYRTSKEAPPNPWTVTTLWRAQYALRLAKTKQDLERVQEYLRWVVARATTSGMLSEQVDPFSGYALSVTPLVWSHAEFVTTVIEYLQKLDDLGLCKVCYPLRRR